MLKLIESVWSKIKAVVKRSLTSRVSLILDNREHGGHSETEFRFEELECAIENAISDVNN